jgi:hypothetical protein
MKHVPFLIAIVFLLVNCSKDKVPVPIVLNTSDCHYPDNISYSQTISPILTNNCNSCHTYPGSGSINLDSYSNVKLVAQSGQLVQSVIHDTNYVIMPPPPRIGLDSCEIKALKIWIQQGCQNN